MFRVYYDQQTGIAKYFCKDADQITGTDPYVLVDRFVNVNNKRVIDGEIVPAEPETFEFTVRPRPVIKVQGTSL